MIINNPNYRSLPEQVDYLTDKQTETETELDELSQSVEDLGETVGGYTETIETIQEDIEDLQEDVAQNTEDISTLNSEVEAVSGRGGYLIPHNFETATPTENQLNAYALSQIPNITQPEEIFNGTRVTNLYNNHTWILNNTQDTDPVVFEWVDLGQSLVSVATNDTLGVVKGSASDFKCSVNNDGTMSVNGIGNALNGKQDKLTTTSVEDGTIDKSIGFDNLGNIVKGSAGGGGGSQLYEHTIKCLTDSNTRCVISIIDSNPNQFTTSNLASYLYNNGYTIANSRQIVKAISDIDKFTISKLSANTIRYKYIQGVNSSNGTSSILRIKRYDISFSNGEYNISDSDLYETINLISDTVTSL